MTLWLQVDGEAGQFNIDESVITVSFDQKSRGYEQIPQFRNGAYISGSGQFSPGSLSLQLKHKKTGTGNAWNAARSAAIYFVTIPFYKKLYVYRTDSYGVVSRAKIVPSGLGAESYTTYSISDATTFDFYFVDAYWEDVTGTTQTQAITSNSLEIMSIDNTGELDVFPQISFTPTSNFTNFQIQLAEGYGFKLSYAFLAGGLIVYKCSDSTITINGNSITGIQTAGSTFSLAPGVNSLQVFADPGILLVAYNRRRM